MELICPGFRDGAHDSTGRAPEFSAVVVRLHLELGDRIHRRRVIDAVITDAAGCRDGVVIDTVQQDIVCLIASTPGREREVRSSP